MEMVQQALADPPSDRLDRRPWSGHADRIPAADARIDALLRYWLEIRGDRVVPDRRDFDPVRVAPVLGYFWILQREARTEHWFFALAGEDTIRLLERRLVGEPIERVFPDEVAHFNEAIETVVSTPAVMHVHGPMYRTDKAPVVAERLALPMGDGEAVDRVYGATVYQWPRDAPGEGARYQGAALVPTLVPAECLVPVIEPASGTVPGR